MLSTGEFPPKSLLVALSAALSGFFHLDSSLSNSKNEENSQV
jgi:hypothetical protein